MDPRLDRKFPSTPDIERVALKRLPKFVGDYLHCGMGSGRGVQHNRDALRAIKLMPKYLVEDNDIELETNLFGQSYSAPFGVAPVGMGGLVWPRCAETLAHTAHNHGIPFSAATFAMSSLETLRNHGKTSTWFQLYRPNNPDIESDILNRASNAGYDVLIVTADIPAPMRRGHDIKNGLSLPFKLTSQNLWQIFSHPRWALAIATAGYPTFENFMQYVPEELNRNATLDFLTELTIGHITPQIIKNLRKNWKGTLLIKGILDADEARQCQNLGVDGVIVSNHGGRQLEAAPSPCDVLGSIRKAVGDDYPLIADSGVRSGLDICRMLALGADFVLTGRPFYYAMAAMGKKGADHIISLFKVELKCVMGQLGCKRLSDLKDRLIQ